MIAEEKARTSSKRTRAVGDVSLVGKIEDRLGGQLGADGFEDGKPAHTGIEDPDGWWINQTGHDIFLQPGQGLRITQPFRCGR